MEGRGLRPVSLSEQKNGKAAPRPAPKKEAAPKKDSVARKDGAPASDAGAGSEAPRPSMFAARKISARMLENFTRLLASLLAAGVPLSRALVILCKEASTPIAQTQWKQIHDSVVDGVSLAESMAKSPDTFPRVYVAMVEAGETGGFLDVVLNQIADFQAREKEMKSKVMAAMLYPVILFCLAIAVVSFLLVFFIPRFTKIFADFNAKLPLLTRMIVATSDLLRSYGPFLIIALIVCGSMIRRWLVSEQGRRKWEGFILEVPLIGPLVAEFALARFCRMLGTLLGAGVPLINGLNVARRSIGNQVLVDAVSNSIEKVKEGKQLGTSLGECRALFAGSILEMISVAEESGRLDQELVRIANVTEGDLDRRLKTAVALAEPLMLFLIAGFIGTIFIGMVVPIFTLQDHVK
jgi:type II secretory pathway component PulF